MADDDRDRTSLLAYQCGVLCRAQALASGLSRDAVRHRIRTGGPWQRLLPGIYLTATGQPTREQLRIAAALYGGPASTITGTAALRNYGIRAAETQTVDILVPAIRSLVGSTSWRCTEPGACRSRSPVTGRFGSHRRNELWRTRCAA